MGAEGYQSDLMCKLNGAAAVFGMWVAKESGMISLFTQPHEPMTVVEIAYKCQLKERYVKEVLGCLVTSKVLDIDDTAERYSLSEQCQPILNGILPFVSFLGYTFQRQEDVNSCMDINGNMGYMAHSKPGFGNAMTELRLGKLDSFVQEEFVNETPDIAEKLETGIEMLEFGSARGPIIQHLAQKYPKCHFTASDYSPQAVSALKESIQSKILTNITAVEANIYQPPEDWTEKFDLVYIKDAVHDLGDPVKGLEQALKTVKRGGTLLVVEPIIDGDDHKENIGCPIAPILFALALAICIPESLSQPRGMALACTGGMKKMFGVFAEAGMKTEDVQVLDCPSDILDRGFVYRKK